MGATVGPAPGARHGLSSAPRRSAASSSQVAYASIATGRRSRRSSSDGHKADQHCARPLTDGDSFTSVVAGGEGGPSRPRWPVFRLGGVGPCRRRGHHMAACLGNPLCRDGRRGQDRRVSSSPIQGQGTINTVLGHYRIAGSVWGRSGGPRRTSLGAARLAAPTHTGRRGTVTADAVSWRQASNPEVP